MATRIFNTNVCIKHRPTRTNKQPPLSRLCIYFTSLKIPYKGLDFVASYPDFSTSGDDHVFINVGNASVQSIALTTLLSDYACSLRH